MENVELKITELARCTPNLWQLLAEIWAEDEYRNTANPLIKGLSVYLVSILKKLP